MIRPVVNCVEVAIPSNVIVVNPDAVAVCHAVKSLYWTTVAKPGPIESANKAQYKRVDLKQDIFVPSEVVCSPERVRGENAEASRTRDALCCFRLVVATQAQCSQENIKQNDRPE